MPPQAVLEKVPEGVSLPSESRHAQLMRPGQSWYVRHCDLYGGSGADEVFDLV